MPEAPAPVNQLPDVVLNQGGDVPRPPLIAVVWDLLADVGVQFFRDNNNDAFANIPVRGHREVYPVRSERFAEFLARLAMDRRNILIGASDMSGIQRAFAGYCHDEAAVLPVYVRQGYDEKTNTIYLDLGRDDFKIVKITSEGWELMDVAGCPLLFRRPVGMDALPCPVTGGTMDALRPFINCTDDAWPLVKAWVVGTFLPAGAYPIACWHGEQGSGKSTNTRFLKELLDPNTVNLLTLTNSEQNLAILAYNCYVPAFDNLSGIKPEIADAMCRLATGGGLRTRKLYTNADEMILKFKRPVLLNGINSISERGDLVQRSILIDTPLIDEGRRRDERTLEAEFQAARPAILGAVLDAVVVSLRDWEKTRLERSPRMADFARWVVASEPVWGDGDFMSTYMENQTYGQAQVIESDAVALAVVQFMDDKKMWEGTASELFKQLRPPEDSTYWPNGAARFGADLRRVSPALRSVAGIEVVDTRTKAKRILQLKKGDSR